MFEYLAMAYKNSVYNGLRRFCHRDRCHVMTQTYPPWCSSALVFSSAAIAQVPTPTFIGRTALKKIPWRFWLHCHDYDCSKMLTCWNSPWWWSYECCNKILLSF